MPPPQDCMTLQEAKGPEEKRRRTRTTSAWSSLSMPLKGTLEWHSAAPLPSQQDVTRDHPSPFLMAGHALYEAKAAADAIISLYEVSKTVVPIIIHTPDFSGQLPASITLYRPPPL
ncbi:hypothetical protein NC652_028981 [Populus alba x Populus x berolinensis]|nr:hypothetical protein NC652_028981 [Populus alba x Populus x berolinensis]